MTVFACDVRMFKLEFGGYGMKVHLALECEEVGSGLGAIPARF
jgi:hypothetical protein